MGNASQTGAQRGDPGVGTFTAYADFNCPFCYALNERLRVMELGRRVELRAIQHAPSISSSDVNSDQLSKLSREVAEVRSRTPSTKINLPLFRPNSGPAAALVNVLTKNEPDNAVLLRNRIFRALWIEGQDISSPDVLSALLKELNIKPPAKVAETPSETDAWQIEWESTEEFERNIPVVISAGGETVIGFPLEPELDGFLKTGSLMSDKLLHGVCEQETLQRILVLDNDLDSLRMVIKQMRDAQVEIVVDFAGLIDSAVNYGMPDLVLVDTALIGGIDSTDWWRNSTDSDIDTAVPVIFVSNENTTEAEVAAFAAGAADFISKPFHPQVLQARLKMHLQARRSQQQLNNIARVDALTSICNRREFDVRLRSEWGRGARTNHSLALLMIDVDKFKEYNDHYGHLRGDDCLVTVAQLLSACMQRAGDLIARYGGEEFVVLLPGSDMEGALEVAGTCLAAIADAELPHVISNVAPYVTISIGVAAMLPIYERSSTLLIEEADIALYQAKQNGRNRICSFEN
ncbi:MAG: diguanylate cyclase [Gammaproteobacteria bacterium]|nr:diguanylate cyclase [Gammaproteobacteria bacterium]